jgi:hypothetical protein
MTTITTAPAISVELPEPFDPRWSSSATTRMSPTTPPRC